MKKTENKPLTKLKIAKKYTLKISKNSKMTPYHPNRQFFKKSKSHIKRPEMKHFRK